MVNHADAQTVTPRRPEPVRLGALSRELRAPLVEALRQLERLQAMRLNPRQRGVLDVAWSSLVSARSMMDTLAGFAITPEGPAPLDLSVFSVGPLVEAVAVTAQPLARQRGLHLDCAVEEAIRGRVEGDRDRLLQLLTTLAGHVIRASSGPTLSIRVRRHFRSDDGRRVTFQISTPRTSCRGAELDAVIGPASWALCQRLAATLGGELQRHGEGETGLTIFCNVVLGRPGTNCNERDQVRRRLDGVQCNLGTVEDLSLAGMRMVCRRARGGRVRVRMEAGQTRVKCRARVIWTRRIADRVHEHGLCFVGLKPKSMAAIHRMAT